jgi:Uma2 family endonuclease
MIPQNKKITYDEFLEIDENTDKPLEFVDGVIYDMSSPSTYHQDIVLNLSYPIKRYLRNKKCKLMISPYDIVLKDGINTHRVQPDLSIICNKEGFTKNNYVGAPTIVIEVLSPSTASKDIVTKMNLYMKVGVEEYWIVSPVSKEIYIYNFEDLELKQDIKTYRSNEILISNIFKNLEIDLKDIFIEGGND